MFVSDNINLRRPTNLSTEGAVVGSQLDTFKAAFGDSYQSMSDMVKTGAGLAVGTTKGIDWWYAGQYDAEVGNQAITDEEFDELNKQYNLGLDRVEGETQTQIGLRAEKKINHMLRRERINPQYGGSALIGGLLPELVNPVNLIPFGRVINSGRFGTKAKQAVAQGKKFRAGFESMKDFTQEAFLGNAAVEPLYYMSANEIGDDYTAQDSFVNILFGTAVGTGFFGSIGSAMNYRMAGRNALRTDMFEDMTRFMESGKFQDAAAYAYQKDPQFGNFVKKYSDLGKKIDKQIKENNTIDFTEFSKDDLKSLQRVTDKYYEGVFQSTLTNELSKRLAEELNIEQGETSVRDVSFKYKRAYASIATAYKRRDFSRLTDFEREVLSTIDTEYAYDIDGFETDPDKSPISWLPNELFLRIKNGDITSTDAAIELLKSQGHIVPDKTTHGGFRFGKESPMDGDDANAKGMSHQDAIQMAIDDAADEIDAALEKLGSKVEAGPKQPKNDFIAESRVVELAQKIGRVLGDSDSKTLTEAIDKGVITRGEAAQLNAAINNSYGAVYAREIEIANRTINEVFGINFKLNKSKFRLGQAAHVKTAFPEEINLNRAEYIIAMQNSGQSPFSLLFHEAGHTLSQADPVSWNMILGIVKGNPKLYGELRQFIGNRSTAYKGDKIDREIPSVMLEWAITKEDFWKELNLKDKSLYEKFKDLVVSLIEKTQALYRSSKLSEVLNDKNLKNLLEDGSPENLAKSIGQIIRASRDVKHFDADAKSVADMIQANIARATNVEEIPMQPRAYQQAKLEGDFLNVFGTVKPSDLLLDILDNIFENNNEFNVDSATFRDVVFDYKQDMNEYEDAVRELFEDRGFLPSRLVEELHTMSRELNELSSNEVVNRIVRNHKSGKFSEGNVDFVRNVYSVLDSQDADAKQTPAEVVRGAIENEYTRKLYRALFDLNVENDLKYATEGLKIDQKIATLRTLLDGQERAGTTAQRTLEINIKAAAEADLNVLYEILDDYGLYDIFFGNVDAEWMKAYRGTEVDKARIKQFGSNIKEASRKFHEQLMDARRNNRLPDSWANTEGLVKLFETLQKLENYQLNKLNSVGAFTRKRKDFAGISQRWESDIVASMTKEEFISDMLNRVDFEETRRLHQNVLKSKEGGTKPFELQEFLGDWYDELTSTKLPDDIQLRIDEGRSRLVSLKPETEADTLLKYSGKENLGKLMVDQINQRAASVEIAKFGGSKPKELWDRVSSFKRLTKKQKVEAQFLNWTVDYLFGDLNSPENHNLGHFGKGARQLGNLAFLSGAGASAFTDVPIAASTLKMQGIDLGTLNLKFIKAYGAAIARRFKGDETGMAAFLRANGAGWDTILNTASQRITGVRTGGKNVMDRANSWLFKINGLNALTSAGQETYVDLFTRGLAEELKVWNDGGEMDDLLKQNLIDNGIAEEDFGVLYQSIYKTEDGVDRIAPSTIVDNDVITDQLRAYMKKYLRQAIITPDAGTNAQGTLGFRAGTAAGESARVATQYQPFQLAMSKLLFRRFKNGYFGQNNPNLHRMSHLMGYVGTALASAYFVTIIKDILKGNEPISLSNMTPRQWRRIVSQSGILGILEVPLDAKDYGVTDALSPIASTSIDLAGDIATFDVEGSLDSLSDIAGGNTLGLGLIGEIFGETLNEIQTSELDYIDKY